MFYSKTGSQSQLFPRDAPHRPPLTHVFKFVGTKDLEQRSLLSETDFVRVGTNGVGLVTSDMFRKLYYFARTDFMTVRTKDEVIRENYSMR
jgi:hypothetical protein